MAECFGGGVAAGADVVHGRLSVVGWRKKGDVSGCLLVGDDDRQPENRVYLLRCFRQTIGININIDMVNQMLKYYSHLLLNIIPLFLILNFHKNQSLSQDEFVLR